MKTDDLFEMQTSAQWKAFSHPLRLQILRLLADEACTNEELAAALGEQSGKLYFHTKKLLDAGLIVLDHTRQKGPITEKLYRAVARGFTVPAPVKGGSVPPLELTLAAGLDLYRSAWEESRGLPGQTEYGYHLVLPHTSERRAEMITRLRTLLDDFKSGASASPGARPTALTVLMHSFDAKNQKKEGEKNDPAIDDTGPADGTGFNGAE